MSPVSRVEAEALVQALAGGDTPSDGDLIAWDQDIGWGFQPPGVPGAHTHPQSEISDWPLTATRGGTELVSPDDGSILVGAGAAPVTLIAPGASGQVVRSTGSAWSSAQLGFSDLSGSLGVAQGGTGLTTYSGTGRLIQSTGPTSATLLDSGATNGHIRSDGSNWVRITGLAAVDLTGSIADARVPASNVTQHQAALAIAFSQVSGIVPIGQGGTALTTFISAGRLFQSAGATIGG